MSWRWSQLSDWLHSPSTPPDTRSRSSLAQLFGQETSMKYAQDWDGEMELFWFDEWEEELA